MFQERDMLPVFYRQNFCNKFFTGVNLLRKFKIVYFYSSANLQRWF